MVVNKSKALRVKSQYLIFREYILADLKEHGVDITICAIDHSNLFDKLSLKAQTAVLGSMKDFSHILREYTEDVRTPRHLQYLWTFFKLKGIVIDPAIFEGLPDDVHFDVYDLDGNCKMISPTVFEVSGHSVDEVFCRDLGQFNPQDKNGSQTLRLIKDVKVQSKYEGWSGYCTISQAFKK